MRIRLNSLALVGTSRRVAFQPGLNIITGPITTGKTTLLRLCRAILGSAIVLTEFPREVRDRVTALAGDVLIGDDLYTIMRPFVSTPTAKVDIAGQSEALRMPSLQPDATSPLTYGQWLLQRLGLPQLEVPSAPTRPESEPTPVTVNDYLLYCNLSQNEIDNAVFGHRDAFKNIKRKYVFQILYGLFNVEMAALLEQLRKIQAQLRQAATYAETFEQLLSGTPLENRSVLVRQVEQARKDLEQLEAAAVDIAEKAQIPPAAQTLRLRLQELDSELGDLRTRQDREQASVNQLSRLLRQLEAQSSRLTKSIVAETYLVDFEFVVCPRCGASISDARGSTDMCCLCLQHPVSRVDRNTLVKEQERLGAQIVETQELVSMHRSSLRELEREVMTASQTRAQIAHELDFQVSSFISDEATRISALASQRATLQSTVSKIEDYQRLYSKLDQILASQAALTTRKEELEAALEVEAARQGYAEDRIQHLEAGFETILQQFRVPRFADHPRATIDRQTYLPVLDGRRFDELSSQGLQVLVNVAHALAHHQAALDLDIPLPGILFIDGLTSNVGHEGLDLERVHGVYDYLITLSQELGDKLQIIVADNDVPREAQGFVRVALSEDDRLIPPEENQINT